MPELQVHYMKYGWTRCGLTAQSQNEWPSHWRWVGPGNEKEVKNCRECEKAAAAVLSGTVQKNRGG